MFEISGKIVIDYLSSNLSAVEYGYQVSCDAYQYNGFNLLLLDRVWRNGHKVYRLVNFINEHSQSSPEELDSGLYGFGNSLRTRPFKKVRRGVELLKRYVENREESESKEETLSKLLRILKDDQSTFPDEQILSQTEQPEELSKAMSQIFYKLPPPYRYGTRSHTILLIDGSNRVTYLESSRDDNCDGIKWHDVRHEFTLDE
ncbi:hypothetical protein AB6A40_006881 [Gnathostoma spinigerum]|uniref:Uncharacterized protein n=1 Tax=Gnathostoma spinigerum TaxID=75299 RepID=A0ABD6ELU8_9BILA